MTTPKLYGPDGLEVTTEERGNWIPQHQLRWGGYHTSSGTVVGEEVTYQVGAVWACVKFLSEQIAQLPLILFRHTEGPMGPTKQHALNHPLYHVLRYLFNPRVTSDEGRRFMAMDYLTRGNAVAVVNRDAAGRVVELHFIPWRDCRIEWDIDAAGVKRLIYIYHPDIGYGQTSENVMRIPEESIWHWKHMSADGLQGISVVTRMRESIGQAYEQQQYGARLFSNDSRPNGVLQHPGNLSDKGYERVKADWDAMHRGTKNAQRVAILEEGMNFNAISFTPEDSQFIESRKFSVTEIARWFGLPSHFVNDLEKATFSNIESQSINFVMYYLMPWLNNVEQTIYRDLLNESERREYQAGFQVQSLLRGDSDARRAYYQSMKEIGALSANEIREYEDLNPIEGGDIYVQPMNFVEAGADTDSEPEPEPDPEPDEEEARAFAEAELREMLLDELAERLNAMQLRDLRKLFELYERAPNAAAKKVLGYYEKRFREYARSLLQRLVRVRDGQLPEDAEEEAMNREIVYQSRYLAATVITAMEEGESPEDVFRRVGYGRA